MNKTTKTILITLIVSLTILPLITIVNATQNPQPKPIKLDTLREIEATPQPGYECSLPIKFYLVVIDPETNKTVGRGYVNAYIVYWLNETGREPIIICWIGRGNVTSEG